MVHFVHDLWLFTLTIEMAHLILMDVDSQRDICMFREGKFILCQGLMSLVLSAVVTLSFNATIFIFFFT